MLAHKLSAHCWESGAAAGFVWHGAAQGKELQGRAVSPVQWLAALWQAQGLLEEPVHIPGELKDRWAGYLSVFQFLDSSRSVGGLLDKLSTLLENFHLKLKPLPFFWYLTQEMRTMIINQSLFHSLDALLPQLTESFCSLY